MKLFSNYQFSLLSSKWIKNKIKIKMLVMLIWKVDSPPRPSPEYLQSQSMSPVPMLVPDQVTALSPPWKSSLCFVAVYYYVSVSYSFSVFYLIWFYCSPHLQSIQYNRYNVLLTMIIATKKGDIKAYECKLM